MNGIWVVSDEALWEESWPEESEKRLISRTHYEYDTVGRLIKELSWLGHFHAERAEKEYFYDQNGREIGWRETHYDANGQTNRKYEASDQYEAGGQNTVRRISLFTDADGSTERTEYVYDGAGRVTEQVNYGKDGSLISCHEYVYNGEIREASTIEYYTGDQLDAWEERSLNEQGNVLCMQVHDASGEIISISDYRYDAHGNMIERTLCDPDGKLLRRADYEHEYDRQNNLVFSKAFCWDRSARSREESPIRITCYEYNYVFIPSV